MRSRQSSQRVEIFFNPFHAHGKASRRRGALAAAMESLEQRQLLSTATVTNPTSSVVSNGRKLSATVNPHGTSTTTQFQISTSSTFATLVPSGSVAATALAVDTAGNAIVYDMRSSSLQKIPPSGPISTIATGVPIPFAMTLDKFGKLFVVPSSGGDIKEYRPGKSTLSFKPPTGANSIAVDGSDNIFIENGAGLTEMPVSGPAKTLLKNGDGGECITIDAAGDLFFENDIKQTIEELPQGSVTPKTVATNVGRLFGIAVDGKGNLFTTANTQAGFVTEIPKGGSPFTLSKGPFLQIAANANGQVFATNDTNGRVFNISPTTIAASPSPAKGSSNVTVSATATGLASNTTYFFRPVISFNGQTTIGPVGSFKTSALPLPTLTTSSAGSISKTGATLNATVNAHSLSTKTLFQVSTNSNFAPTIMANIGSGFSEPTGVAVDSAGNVYIADDSKNAVFKIAPGKKPVVIGSGFNTPEGVAVDAAGDVFVADTGNNDVVEIFTNGTILNIDGELSGPTGVAVDAAGDVFIADTNNSAIREVTSTRTFKTIGKGFSFPSGLAVDAKGDVFVADSGNNAIKEIKTDGSVHFIRSGLHDPQGVALDSAGDVYIADSGNNAVTEILANGTAVQLGSGFQNPFGIAVDLFGDVFIGDQNDSRTIELSRQTVTSSTLSSSSTASIKGSLTGLKAKTKYFYRAIALSSAGTTLGQIKSFTTT
jgi:large repetitive protein